MGGGDSKSMQPDQLRKLTRKWAIPIILVTILGAAASYLVSKRLTPMYAATGKMVVAAGPGVSGGSAAIPLSPSEATNTAASLLTGPALLQQVIRTLHLQMTTDSLAKQVTATAETNTELVDVIVNDPSPDRAASIANALMSAYIRQVNQVNAQQTSLNGADILSRIATANAKLSLDKEGLAAAVSAGRDTTSWSDAISTDNQQLSLLASSYGTFLGTQAQSQDEVYAPEPATAPSKPASPNTLLNTIAGALAALVIVAGFAYLREFLDQGLKTAEDVRDRLDVPCLGVIPKFRHLPVRGKSFAPNHRHDEAVREAYRRLRVNLLFATPDEELKTVVVTSVRAGEGKTCTAANLAVALAGSDRRVLLIDADLRKPDQHRLFETPLEGGLSELILNTPTTSAVPTNGLRRTQFANLRLLTSGTVPANPAELLASKRGMAVLKSIGPDQDLIVVDTAPAVHRERFAYICDFY